MLIAVMRLHLASLPAGICPTKIVTVTFRGPGQEALSLCGCAGLLLSSFALHMAAPGQRLVPEPLTFASALLSTAVPQPATAVAHTQQWLLPSETWASLSGATPPLNLAEVLQSSSDDARFQLDSFTGSLLQAALGVVSRASEVFAKLVSFPELFAPAMQALAGLRTAKDLPQVRSSS